MITPVAQSPASLPGPAASRQGTGRRWARGVCRAILRALARVRSRPGPPQSVPGAVVVIAPHPDDAEFGCAGLIRHRRLDQVDVTVICVTDGAASHPAHPSLTPGVLAIQRAAEAGNALRLLGVAPEAIVFLGVPDGQLAHLDSPARDQLVDRLTAALRRAAPTEVYTAHRHDGSSEHEALFPLLVAAVGRIGERPRIFEYPIWAWWSPRLLLKLLCGSGRIWRMEIPAHLEAKRRALACHRSQIEPSPPWTDPVLPVGFAESFLGRAEYFFEA